VFCPHGTGQAAVWAGARLGVLRTRATRLAALDRALGPRTVAHGFGDGQISGELANAKPDIIGRGRSGHVLSYGYIHRKSLAPMPLMTL
jgi:hypothetical protein